MEVRERVLIILIMGSSYAKCSKMRVFSTDTGGGNHAGCTKMVPVIRDRGHTCAVTSSV